MLLKDFLKISREKFWIYIVCIIVVLAGVFYYDSKVRSTYEGNIGFSIVRFGEIDNSEFSDYYAVQADTLVTNNFVKWLKSRPFTSAVYDKAKIDLDNQELNQRIKTINAIKVSGTDIAFGYEAYGLEDTENVGKAIIEEVAKRTSQIKKEQLKNDQNLRGLEVSSKLTIRQKSNKQSLNYVLGFIGALILGAVIIVIYRYFMPKKR